MNPSKAMLKDLYHMCSEMMNQNNIKSMAATLIRIKKILNITAAQNINESRTIPVHNSLHHETGHIDADASDGFFKVTKTETLLDYHTGTLSQSSKKGSSTNDRKNGNTNSSQNSEGKYDGIGRIYGKKGGKGKKIFGAKKSSSMKACDGSGKNVMSSKTSQMFQNQQESYEGAKIESRREDYSVQH